VAGEPDVLWLRDLLPQYVPQARIMTYGYNSAIWTSAVRNIDDDAKELLLHIRNQREVRRVSHFEISKLHTIIINQGDVPILFIAHSLGGLVVKQVRTLYMSSLKSCFAHPRIGAGIGAIHSEVPVNSHSNKGNLVYGYASFSLLGGRSS